MAADEDVAAGAADEDVAVEAAKCQTQFIREKNPCSGYPAFFLLFAQMRNSYRQLETLYIMGLIHK